MGGIPEWRPSVAKTVDEFRLLIAETGSRLVGLEEVGANQSFTKVQNEFCKWLHPYNDVPMDRDFWETSNGRCFAIAYARVEDVGRVNPGLLDINNRIWHVHMLYFVIAPSIFVYRMIDNRINGSN